MANYLWLQAGPTTVLEAVATFERRTGRSPQEILCHPVDLPALRGTLVGGLAAVPPHGVVQVGTVWVGPLPDREDAVDGTDTPPAAERTP